MRQCQHAVWISHREQSHEREKHGNDGNEGVIAIELFENVS